MDQSSPTVQFSRVLVADDSETIQKVVRIALGRQPVKVDVASSWPETAAKLADGAAVLLLDPNLPGIDSSEEKIREVVGAAGKTPVLVMIGSHERLISDETLKACGIQETIHKPFDSSELVSLVMRLVESVGGRVETPAASVESDSSEVALPSGFSPPPPPPGADDIKLELPPLPDDLVDASRKGKKAFDLDPDKLFEFDSTESTEATGSAVSSDDFSADVANISSNERSDALTDALTDGLTEGLPDGLADDLADGLADSLANNLSSGTAAIGTPVEAKELNQEVLAREVRKAVEDYCAKHFRSLAIEVITAELRRLAEEKARHLVDI